MKLEISVKFIDEDGSEAIKPVVIDTSVPGFDDFHDVNDFLPVFHQLEQTGLELRDETFSTALTHYLEEMSKETPSTASHPKDNALYNRSGSWPSCAPTL